MNIMNLKCGVFTNLVQIRGGFVGSYLRLPILYYSTSPKSKKEDLVGVVGLEVHAQINSVSKLFSGAGTDFVSPVNCNVSLFDAAIPGTLPVLNKRCVEAGVLTALALKSSLSPVSMFDRKHYFYADLPQGYQITQQRMPLARGGELQFQVIAPGVNKEPYSRTVRLHQLQLEQDSGKSLHDDVLNRSLIDLNRAAVPLMELVFEPDLADGDEAVALVKELSLVLTKLDTCLCTETYIPIAMSRSLIDLNRAGVPLMELVFEPDLADGDEAVALVKELSLVLTKLDTCLCTETYIPIAMSRSLIDLNRAGVPLMELVFEPDLADGDEAVALVKELSLVLTKLDTCLCTETYIPIAMSRSLIDLNRAGVPLMELVFEPDLADGDEAVALVKELSLVLTKLDTCLCKMEEGGMRVDANVSVHKPGTPLGVRTEVKNIGSVRGVGRAVNYEIQRQRELLRGGGHVVNETRSWDAERNVTVPMRDKEEKQDYRFMPEPNLPPLRLDMDGSCRHPHMVSVPDLLAAMPELPAQTRLRLQTDYNLSLGMVARLVNEPELLRMFESTVSGSPPHNPITVANLLTMELMTLVNKELCSLGSGRPSDKDIGELTDLLQNKKINLATARSVLEAMAGGATQSATEIVTSGGMWLVAEPAEIENICEEAIQRNPKLVEAYRKGKTKVFKALLGDVAKVTHGRADMNLVSKTLEDMLKKG